MPFPKLIFKNLRQRFGRTAMTIAGISIAVTAITSLWSIVWGYAESANNYYSARDADIVVVRAGVSIRLTSILLQVIRVNVLKKVNSLKRLNHVFITYG